MDPVDPVDAAAAPRPRAVLAALVDLALVAVFTAIGRASHREDEAGFGITFWPFAVGLAVGWIAARAWRTPFGILRAGVPAWLGAVVVGMLLRAVSGQGVQFAFVVVAAIVLGLFLVGWRALVVAIDRSASRGSGTPGPVAFFLRRK